jgi:CTP:phosphocholine cytidylyltransferase-like protein
MLNYGVVFLGHNEKKIDDKVVYTLFLKEQFKYLKTAHSYHLVDPSP